MDAKTKRKYNLHYKVRKQGYKVLSKQKTIVKPYNQTIKSAQAKKLIGEYGYVIQNSIC